MYNIKGSQSGNQAVPDSLGMPNPMSGPVPVIAPAAPAPSPQTAPEEVKIPSKHHAFAYVLSIIIIAALVAILYFYSLHVSSGQHGSTTVPSYTTSAGSTINQSSIPPNATSTSAFLSKYNLTAQLPAMAMTDVFTNASGSCNYYALAKWYQSKYIPNPPITAVNYSALNDSTPFAEYASIYIPAFQPSSNSRCASLRGPQSVYSLKNESESFSEHNTTVSGITMSVVQIDNLTQQGLNATATYYTGPKPSISWYVTYVYYGNTIISLGQWGFTGHMNATLLVAQTASLTLAYESYK